MTEGAASILNQEWNLKADRFSHSVLRMNPEECLNDDLKSVTEPSRLQTTSSQNNDVLPAIMAGDKSECKQPTDHRIWTTTI